MGDKVVDFLVRGMARFHMVSRLNGHFPARLPVGAPSLPRAACGGEVPFSLKGFDNVCDEHAGKDRPGANPFPPGQKTRM